MSKISRWNAHMLLATLYLQALCSGHFITDFLFLRVDLPFPFPLVLVPASNDAQHPPEFNVTSANSLLRALLFLFSLRGSSGCNSFLPAAGVICIVIFGHGSAGARRLIRRVVVTACIAGRFAKTNLREQVERGAVNRDRQQY
jgi:hypothetical protein